MSMLPPNQKTNLARQDVLTGVIFVVVASSLMIFLLISRSNSYWNFSDGVYLYSSRAVLEGSTLYQDLAAAQPPPIYLIGAAALGVLNTLESVRVLLAAFQLATALGVLLVIRRLTGSNLTGVVGGVLALLTPRALHDFANLLPELIAAPFVLASAALASRSRTALSAGALGAVAISVKLAFVFPILAVLVVTPKRLRFSIGVLITGLLLAALFFGVYGTSFLEGTLLAQGDSGIVGWDLFGREILQATWNILPLLPAAIVGFTLRSSSEDRPLFNCVWAAAIGSCLVFVTIIKNGAYINLVVVAEPLLLIVAVCGAFWLFGKNGSLFKKAVVVGCLVLGLIQAGSLIASPGNPELFARPFDKATYGWIDSPSQVDQKVAVANECPADQAYSGDPYLAFESDRRMPGNQGDTFILGVGEIFSGLRDKANRDIPTCPDQISLR